MDNARPSFATLALKTIVVHTITYFVCGILAFYFLDYAHKFAEPGVRDVMRQTNEPIVMAGPLFQPIRGLLFAIAFYPIRSAIFGRKHGWVAMWLLLLILGIFNTFGPCAGSVEGLVYTIIPLSSQLLGLREVVPQVAVALDHPLLLGRPSRQALAHLATGRALRHRPYAPHPRPTRRPRQLICKSPFTRPLQNYVQRADAAAHLLSPLL